MKVVVQRVSQASVTKVETGEIVGSISQGLFCLVGVKQTDTKEHAIALAQKIAKLRVCADDSGKMNRSIQESEGSILVVSQFTLYSDTSGGNRPSFIEAADASLAQPLYELFIETLSDFGIVVERGSFGNMMSISAVLDGPVTILLEK